MSFKFSKEVLVEVVGAFLNALLKNEDASQQFRDMEFVVNENNELSLTDDYYIKYPRTAS